MSSTWAVVLVHGVGDTEPGATLGAFIPALQKHGKKLEESAAPQTRLLVEPPPELPPRGASLEPASPAEEGKKPLAGRFPMHLRSFRIADAKPGEPDKAVFAEVFWADLSRAGESRWAVLKRAISLVFDLRHLSNVAAAHPNLPSAARLRIALYWVSWLLCGPIAGLTAFMFALYLARAAALSAYGMFFSAPLPPLAEDAAVLGMSLGAVAGAYFWRKALARYGDETWMLFVLWILVGAAVTAFVAAVRFAVPSFPWETSLGPVIAWSLQFDLADAVPGPLATYFAVLLWQTYAAFSVLALGAVLAFVAWLRARAQAGSAADAPRAALDAALGASMLQVMLWILIATGMGWVVLDKLFGADGVASSVLTGFTLKLGVAAAIGACAAGVWAWRRRVTKEWLGKKNPAAEYKMPRLLLNGWIIGPLIGLTLLSVVIFAVTFVTGSSQLHDWVEPASPYIRGFVVLVGALMTYFWREVRNALHILIDVTSHFYRKRLDPRRIEVRPNDFTTQQRIEARSRRVLQEVLQPRNEVSRVTVVAHSQGTVIALDLLWLEWTGELLKGKQVDLVTMGSPFSHLYQFYFPHRYPPLFAGAVLNNSWGKWLDTTVQSWTNIHRIDDYIGTQVNGRNGFPDNPAPFGDGGHTGYWHDERAIPLIANHLPG